MSGNIHHKESTYKEGFIPTREYLNYLDNKQLQTLKNKCILLKIK
jgi:hypothetical protein